MRRRRACILVVDSDRNMREVLDIHLRNAGYDVRVAEDGVAAGRHLLKDRPDLVITDTDMRRMNGYDFVAALRAEDQFAGIPVIFLSAEEPDDRRTRQLGGRVEYARKPILSDRLLALVAKHLSERPVEDSS